MTLALPASALPARLLRLAAHALVALLVAGCAVGSPPARSSSDSDLERVSTPPGRVGKVGLLSGPVTLTDLGTGEQQPASLNWPITSGQRLTTGGLSRAEVRIGSLAVRLDGDTDVDFNRIDDEVIQIVVQRGSVALRARSRELLPEIDLVTPRERIVLDDVGRYRIDVDRASGITALTAYVGAARIASGRMTFSVRSGQRGEIGSMAGTGFTLVQPSPDTFDDWVASRDRRDDSIASARYVSPETTGVEVLDDYGTWRTVADYGPVWFPATVPAGWAPYRYGRWAYVAPWGWTWIDDAPWGFAPFHYGRWAIVGGAWCWVPGRWVARPVYAPALVAWYGTPGVSVTVGVGSVGWFPLGPREVYVPPYRYDRRYITGVNIGHVGSIDYRNVAPPPRYVHATPRTATWVPNDAIVRQEPIRRVVQAPPADVSQFVGRPTPPQVISDGIKRRPPETVPGRGDAVPGRGDIVRPQPAPAFTPPAVTPGAPTAQPGGPAVGVPRPLPPGAPGSKFPANPPPGGVQPPAVVPSAPPAAVPPAVAPQPAPQRPPEFVRPMPRLEDGPGRKFPAETTPRFEPPAPRPEPVRPMPAPQPAAPAAPPPKIEQVAPPPRMVMPRPEAPAPGRSDIVRPAPRAPEAPRAEPPRAEPPRGEGRGEAPRGSKFVRE